MGTRVGGCAYWPSPSVRALWGSASRLPRPPRPLPAPGNSAARTADCDAVSGAKVKLGYAGSERNVLSRSEAATREQRTEDRLLLRRKNGDITTLAGANVSVIAHVISKDDTRAGGNIPDSMIAAQIDVLNQAYGGQTGGAATGFSFTLTKTTRTVNPRWYDMAKRSAERQAKTALHEGGANTLNMYFSGLGQGLLGYATFPGGDLAMDGVNCMYEFTPGQANRMRAQWATYRA